MKKMAKLWSLLLALTLALTTLLSTAVFAEGEEEEPLTAVTLVKILKTADEEIKIPEGTVYEFTFTFTAQEANQTIRTGLPIPRMKGEDFEEKVTFSSENELMHSLDITEDLKKQVTVPGAVYGWKVVEDVSKSTPAKTDKERLTFDTNEYYLFATMEMGENDEKEYKFIIFKRQEESGKVVYKKAEGLEFENIYEKLTFLEITNKVFKEIEGGEPITDVAFDYKLIIDKPETVTAESYSYTIKDEKDKVLVTGTGVYGEVCKFELYHGQIFDTELIPVGTKYQVTQEGKEKYESLVRYGKIPDRNKTDGSVKEKRAEGTENLIVPEEAKFERIAEEGSFADFVNIIKDIPITGMIIKVLPFVALIGAGIVVLGIFFLSSRRRED